MKGAVLPSKLSIIELGVMGSKLGVDVDAIREKYMDMLFKELLAEVKSKLRSQKCKHHRVESKSGGF